MYCIQIEVDFVSVQKWVKPNKWLTHRQKNNKNRFYRVASIVKQGRVRNNNNHNNEGMK